jgi:hypothetical protein
MTFYYRTLQGTLDSSVLWAESTAGYPVTIVLNLLCILENFAELVNFSYAECAAGE